MLKTDPRTLTLAALVLAALAVFFLLPRFVSAPLIAVPDVAPQPSPGAVSPSAAAEKRQFREQAQATLAAIFALKSRLENIQVSAWAGAEFAEADALVTAGDQLYSRGEYPQAQTSYQQALDRFQALETLAADKRAAALTEAPQAIEAGDLARAEALVTLLQQLAPAEDEVKILAARLATLPALLEHLNQGKAARADNRLADAVAAFGKAVALDGAHQQAKTLLAEAENARRSQGFNQWMGEGYRAMDGGDFAAAERAFAQAAQAEPGSGAVAQAQAQLASRRLLVGVDQQLAEARQHEQQENWPQAVTIYQALIAQDASLTEPRVRLIPAQVRAELDGRLAKLIADPLALSRAEMAARARQTLADAEGIAAAGPRLAGQIAELDTLLDQAQRPVAVEFQSDGFTQVTLYRVEKLGQFQSRVLELKPGNYTAAGVRQGYRDVVVDFTVTGAALAPVVVRCTEPI